MQTNQLVMSFPNSSERHSVKEFSIFHPNEYFRLELPVGTSGLENKYGRNSLISGIKGKICSNEKKDHFLDYAKNCDENIVQDRTKIIEVFIDIWF